MTWFIEPLAEGQHCVAAIGELDLASEQPFFDGVSEVLADPGTHRVVIDLSRIEFIDSSGVRALVRLRHAFADRVVLGDVSKRVQAVLEIAGLNGRLGSIDEDRQPQEEGGGHEQA